MKVVIAPDSYKESLTAMEVATAIEAGFRQVLPEADYIKLPMADGGEGTAQSLIDATGGTRIDTTVTGPLGTPVQGFFGLLGDGITAVIEMAAASGLHLVPQAQRNPLHTTSFGTGELIKAALDHGAGHIILGIGGSATNDGGIGMAQALGGRLLDRHGKDIGRGGAALANLATLDMRNLDPRLARVKLEVACDVDNPLCGPTGASQIFGPQKGATSAMVRQLDANLAHYAALIHQQLGREVLNTPGAGAAGGLGAALLGLLDASLRPGIDMVAEAAGLAEAVQDADWVITGEGRIDRQSIHGKTPIGVARVAKQYQRPVIAIAGSVAPDAAVVHQHGIDAVFSVVPGAMPLEQALAEAAANVEATARNVAALIQLQHAR
ncbi:glycerate kinase [Photobacterium atrarenae]|uniref:Glycerate kinase n=1 Tax=Photobacterium atrarenae TaxID=865757 RepID=A0ABY5GFR0_9GAMM|nr:glycerate kinase [Photobacterium atrarenae]UTV28103.1 glycerate kinase [Photobacterium atrarenae]